MSSGLIYFYNVMLRCIFPRLIFNMLCYFCKISYYLLRLGMWLTVVMEKIDKRAFLAHCRHSQCSPYVLSAGLDSKMVKPRFCFHSSSRSGAQERQSVAYGHNPSLQLCLVVCLLPMSGNSYSTCLFAAFQSGGICFFSC